MPSRCKAHRGQGGGEGQWQRRGLTYALPLRGSLWCQLTLRGLELRGERCEVCGAKGIEQREPRFLNERPVWMTPALQASITTILLWIYYSSLILLFEAEFTKAYVESRGSRRSLAKG